MRHKEWHASGRGSKERGAVATVAEENKTRSHGGHGGCKFVTFAVGTYGCIGKVAVEILCDWADVATRAGGFERDAYLRCIKRELSVTLVHGNAQISRDSWVCRLVALGKALWKGWACLCWNECVCWVHMPGATS